jgi:hypothetical protein
MIGNKNRVFRSDKKGAHLEAFRKKKLKMKKQIKKQEGNRGRRSTHTIIINPQHGPRVDL